LGGLLTIFAIVFGILIFRRRDTHVEDSKLRPPFDGRSEQGAH
jgi:hypothetical protein